MASRKKRRSPKTFSSFSSLAAHIDIKKWFSKEFLIQTFSNHPRRQLIVAALAVLLCLYIALIAALGQRDKPDETILLSGITLDDVFTQKTMRSVRSRMELSDASAIYLYEPPTVTVDAGGTVTSFSLPLATTEKNKYDLWTMNYQLESATLYLEQTKRNLSTKDLAFDLTQLPTEDIIKTFLKFPAKYVAQVCPIPTDSVYQFTPASSPAVLNFSFGEEVSGGMLGLWISRSGGGSVIDGSFVPTGDYLSYYCSCTGEAGTVQQFLVMTEIQYG